MKKTLLFAALAAPLALAAQPLTSPTAAGAYVHTLGRTAQTAADSLLPFDEALAPFYHGVASGDPLTDRVIIWTRVTPDGDTPDNVAVEWFVGTDVAMTDVVQQGTFQTNAARDYTVKVDVTGLNAGTTYYYYFRALNANSLLGRTKTLPDGSPDHLKFAVVSCSNYEAGFFSNYRNIGQLNDLDAVIHLGDYIYEYGRGVYGDTTVDSTRFNVPEDEIITLADYRTRYSLYRLDADLRRAHQQHPFITVWDDHESANDAYVDGAENHDEGEGDWEDRKQISRQVYAEWMPIRGQADTIYRTFEYGDLAEFIMVDTRLEGRQEQLTSVLDPALFAPERTLLGEQQKGWFFDQLEDATARWKVVGNQVMFSEFNVGWADQSQTDSGFAATESIFLDIWDGYPAERDSIIRFLDAQDIDNTIILTGDFHSSFAYDVALRPSVFSPNVGAPFYDPATGANAVAVEFVTPSITSANFDENVGAATAAGFEFQINNPLPTTPPVNPNPHMKYVDLDRHGYYLLDLKPDSAQANFFFNLNILDPSLDEEFGAAYYTLDGTNRLLPAATASAPKATQEDPTPEVPFVTTNLRARRDQGLAFMSLYPNPARDLCLVSYALARAQRVEVYLTDAQGRRVRTLLDTVQPAHLHTLTFSADDLTPGVYFLRLVGETGQATRRVVVK